MVCNSLDATPSCSQLFMGSLSVVWCGLPEIIYTYLSKYNKNSDHTYCVTYMY